MVTIGYFCKTTDNIIYDGAEKANQSYEAKAKEWQDDLSENIIIEKVFEGNVDEIDECFTSIYCLIKSEADVIIDEALYVENKKLKLKEKLSDYRWTLINSEMYINGQKIITNEEGRAELYEAIAGYLDLAPGDRPDTISFKKPGAVTVNDWSQLDPANLLGWRGMYAMTNSKHSRDCELALWSDIEVLTTKDGIDAFDYIADFDALLKPLLSIDLTKCAYPKKYHDIDNP